MTADQVRERQWICARRLRERRHALGLTQTAVVERLAARGAATSNRSLSAMENGHGLHLGWLPALAEALDCTTTYLLGLTDDPACWLPDRAAAAATARRQRRAGWVLGPDLPGTGAPARLSSAQERFR